MTDEEDCFWSQVRIGDGCWPWTGRTIRDRKGRPSYGAFGKAERAHRAAWRFAHGPIPAGMFVCHRCDVPGCGPP